MILFLKMFKIWWRFQKWKKKLENILYFLDNCILTSNKKFWKSQTEYLSLAVYVLRNTTKIPHINKGDILQISSSESDEKRKKSSPIQISQVFGSL